MLSIRSEDGALRHMFSASTTLLQVREWLLQEQPAISRPDSTIYFMTMMPRAEYLSEERMGTTLAEAGLTPDGTVMVRRQLVAPPPPPSGLSGPDDDGPEIGAGWKRTGEKAGDYVSLQIDDPTFGHPIRANLFQSTDDKSAWGLHWNRPPKRSERD